MPHFTLSLDPALGPVITAIIAVSRQRTEALKKAGLAVTEPQRVRALLDTGASCTCVDPAVLAALQLTPTGSTQVYTPSSGTKGSTADTYDVGLGIFATQHQPPLLHATIPVVASDLRVQGIDALIGRDVLKDCLLSYNGLAGIFTLAF